MLDRYDVELLAGALQEAVGSAPTDAERAGALRAVRHISDALAAANPCFHASRFLEPFATEGNARLGFDLKR